MGFGGGPYNLTSTVTAGIVSAKARDLGTSEFNPLFKPTQR
jgi:S1-C subfamily serine protease